MFGFEGSEILPVFVDLHCPLTGLIDIGFENSGIRPYRELHGMSVPLHEDAELLSGGVYGPFLGEGHVGKVIGPMG